MAAIVPVNVSTVIPFASSGPDGPLIRISSPASGAGRTRKAFSTQCGSTPPASRNRTLNCVSLATTKLDDVHCPAVVLTVTCAVAASSAITSTRS